MAMASLSLAGVSLPTLPSPGNSKPCYVSRSSTNLFGSNCRSSSRVSSRTPAAASSSSSSSSSSSNREVVFFDGGPHYGDLVANLIFGLSLIWLPLTVAAVLRALFLRYRFTNVRVTILSGLTGGDRKDFAYNAIKDVKYVPRFVGEWGDVVITLRDDTKVELKCVPRFREIAKYCLESRDASLETAQPEAQPARAGKGFA